MKVAVLGLGSIGLRHARNFTSLGAQVIGYDPSAERSTLWQAEGGAIAGSRDAALAASDAVVVASPSGLHLSDIAAAVAAGRHMLVEKPLAHTDQGVEVLLDRAQQSGLIVAAAFNLRFLPAVERARQVIMQDMIGKPLWARLICSSYLPDWRPHQDHLAGYANDPRAGGVLFDIIHEFDLACHLLGPAHTQAAVAGNTHSIGLDTEDCADVLLRHASGPIANIHLDYVTRPRRRTVEVAGTHGMLVLEVSQSSLTIYAPDGGIADKYVWDQPASDSYIAEAKDFLAAITGRVAPRCDGREALSVLRLVLKARELAGLAVSSGVARLENA